jgi:hypothetical protein
MVTIKNMNNNLQKVAYLESLGIEVHDYDTKGLPTDTVAFSTSEGDFDIEFDCFDIGDTLVKICYVANQYSCCGDILDPDYMICPTCKEHC